MTEKNKIVVITAGGTIEAIDSVRSIQNSSSGKLGSLIAEEMKNEMKNAKIIYISNRFAIRPNIEHTWIETTSVLDVKEKIQELLENIKVDIFIHSMAVADYYVDGLELGDGEFTTIDSFQQNKLSSEHDNVKIVLKKAPKIITLIKEWQPLVYLVGFKLLNQTTEKNLFDVGFQLLRKNRCNLVLANDMDNIKKGNHEGLLIYPEKKYDKIKGKENISQYLSKVITNRAFCKHSNSIRLTEDANVPDEVLANMKLIGEQLYTKGLLPDVEGGTYGNLSIRERDHYFITGRNVHKGNLTADIVCKIEECIPLSSESVYAHVNYHGKVKPSIDSAIHHAIYSKLPEANSILHVHTDDLFNRPLSSYNFPCGTMEERDSIVNIMTPLQPLIQMKKHGVVIAGTTLQECLVRWNELYDELLLRPFLLEKNEGLWKEWVTHVDGVGGITKEKQESLLNPENYYTIEEKGIVYGLCYISISNDDRIVQFAMYTSEEFQKAGKGIGRKTINILEQIKQSEGMTLELVTRPLCGVEDYYKKQGFTTHSVEDDFIYMRKN